LALSGVVPVFLGFAGAGYTIVAALLGLNFVRLSWLVIADAGNQENLAAKKLFGFSIVYLFALFSALLADNLISGIL
jgi:protoheme IX farnesyltransferase